MGGSISLISFHPPLRDVQVLSEFSRSGSGAEFDSFKRSSHDHFGGGRALQRPSYFHRQESMTLCVSINLFYPIAYPRLDRSLVFFFYAGKGRSIWSAGGREIVAFMNYGREAVKDKS